MKHLLVLIMILTVSGTSESAGSGDQDSTTVLVETLTDYWNGTSWDNGFKTVIEYDAHIQKVKETMYGWSGLQYDEISRTIYIYNSLNQLVEQYKEDKSINWNKSYAFTFIYNVFGRVIEKTRQLWMGDSIDYYTEKTITLYDDGNNISEEVRQTLSNEKWLDFDKANYSYDTSNNLLQTLRRKWTNDDWENWESYAYAYDGSSKKISSTQLAWSDTLWDTLNMYTFLYDDNGFLREDYRKVKHGGVWTDASLETFTNSMDGNIITDIFQYWVDSVLVNGSRGDYEYSLAGEVIRVIDQVWKNESWENASGIEYGYDGKDNMISKTYLLWNDTAWTYAGRNLYTYQTLTTGIDNNILPDRFILSNNYPNPFNPTTTIHYSVPVKAKVRVAVYSLLGQRISTLVETVAEPGEYQVIFDASRLSSGIYLYKMDVGNSSLATKKM